MKASLRIFAERFDKGYTKLSAVCSTAVPSEFRVFMLLESSGVEAVEAQLQEVRHALQYGRQSNGKSFNGGRERKIKRLM